MKRRNKFSLSNYKLLSCSMGQIVPCGCFEVLPGDTIQQATSLFVRVAPMAAPVMHPVHAKIHHFYVPYRLLWDEWEDFITGGPDGLNTSEFPTITTSSSNTGAGTLFDYLGVDPGTQEIPVSALPIRAYNMIYNEWYRDQDLGPELAFSTDSGPDTTTVVSVQNANWEKDYFTTTRPWPQKGVDVTIPVTGGTELTGSIVPDNQMVFTSFSQPSVYGTLEPPAAVAAGTSGQLNLSVSGGSTAPWSALSDLKYRSGLALNLSGGTADIGSVSVNDMRQAFALQRFEEHRALYGSRYVEYLRYLGVRASDARLQRPEYLGGGKQTIQFSEVLQTAEGDDPVGTLRGHGIGAVRSNRFRRFIEEHGIVMSFVVIRPVAIYAQAIERLWLRTVKEDFWQKELEHIGQQEVLNREIYGPSANGSDTFGYQNRYDDYRRIMSSVSGEFRDILDYWHLARVFTDQPVLNEDFVRCIPSPRIFAAQENDHFYCMANHSIQARRILSQHGNPI